MDANDGRLFLVTTEGVALRGSKAMGSTQVENQDRLTDSKGCASLRG